jgi:hypothetical protein
MELTQEQKEYKKELAKHKRKVVELAGVVHDKLPQLGEDIVLAMKEVNAFLEEHPYLK